MPVLHASLSSARVEIAAPLPAGTPVFTRRQHSSTLLRLQYRLKATTMARLTVAIALVALLAISFAADVSAGAHCVRQLASRNCLPSPALNVPAIDHMPDVVVDSPACSDALLLLLLVPCSVLSHQLIQAGPGHHQEEQDGNVCQLRR